MQKFKILEHKADLKIRVFGGTKEELFTNALFGMASEMKAEIKEPEEKAEREINIKAVDLSALLVDFLSEALYLSEVNQEVYQQIQFKKFTDKNIEGILIGKKLKRIGVVIKGVTYHDLDVHRKKDKAWEATILFDI